MFLLLLWGENGRTSALGKLRITVGNDNWDELMYFDEFAVGTEFTAGPRQVTEAEVKTFTDLSLLQNRIFLDDAAAQAMGHPKRILPAPLLISLAMGLCQQRGLFDHMFDAAQGSREPKIAFVYRGLPKGVCCDSF